LDGRRGGSRRRARALPRRGLRALPRARGRGALRARPDLARRPPGTRADVLGGDAPPRRAATLRGAARALAASALGGGGGGGRGHGGPGYGRARAYARRATAPRHRDAARL